jgi:hypothetical protein
LEGNASNLDYSGLRVKVWLQRQFYFLFTYKLRMLRTDNHKGVPMKSNHKLLVKVLVATSFLTGAVALTALYFAEEEEVVMQVMFEDTSTEDITATVAMPKDYPFARKEAARPRQPNSSLKLLTGKTVLGERRGKVSGHFNSGYAEGGSGGIGDMLGGLMAGGGGSITHRSYGNECERQWSKHR